MVDADLIYDAMLRVERRLEEKWCGAPVGSPQEASITPTLVAVQMIREEIGRGLAAERI